MRFYGWVSNVGFYCIDTRVGDFVVDATLRAVPEIVSRLYVGRIS